MDLDILKKQKQLGQSRPANTSAATLYTCPVRQTALITSVNVANVTNVNATYSLYLHLTGTTYDQSTALTYQANQAANTSALVVFDSGAVLKAGGSFGIQSGTSSAITYTLHGLEF